jgi:hypothetical protein
MAKCLVKHSSQLQISLFMQPLTKGKKAADIQPNPLLLKTFPALLESTIGCGLTVEQIINKLPWSKSKQWSKAIACPTGSWRRMYAEQPPKHHIFELGNGHGHLKRVSRTIDGLFSAIVSTFSHPNKGITFDRLGIEDHAKKRTYSRFETIRGDKLEPQKHFKRVLRASSNERTFQ